jgi:hypothetical protein
VEGETLNDGTLSPGKNAADVTPVGYATQITLAVAGDGTSVIYPARRMPESVKSSDRSEHSSVFELRSFIRGGFAGWTGSAVFLVLDLVTRHSSSFSRTRTRTRTRTRGEGTEATPRRNSIASSPAALTLAASRQFGAAESLQRDEECNQNERQNDSMNEDKHLIIHFNNGAKMDVSFPTQIKNSMGALMEALKRILEGDKLVIHTEQQVVVIPWSSVQYIESSSVAATALPLGAIKGARIVESKNQAAA